MEKVQENRKRKYEYHAIPLSSYSLVLQKAQREHMLHHKPNVLNAKLVSFQDIFSGFCIVFVSCSSIFSFLLIGWI